MSETDPVVVGARTLMARMAAEARAVLAGTAEPGYGKRLALMTLELDALPPESSAFIHVMPPPNLISRRMFETPHARRKRLERWTQWKQENWKWR